MALYQSLISLATVPGLRPRPGFERSVTSPDVLTRGQPVGSNDQTPRASAFPGMVHADMRPLSILDQLPQKSLRKVSSMTLAKELSPLKIPHKKSMQLPKSLEMRSTPVVPENMLPPQVPPKSPRTESRASPRAHFETHSASSSVSTLHSDGSISHTPMSSSASLHTDCHHAEQRSGSVSATATKSPGTPFSKFNKYHSIRNHSPNPKRKESDEDPKSLWSKLIPNKTVERPKMHSRGLSETSAFDSDRRHTGKATGIRRMRNLVLGTAPAEIHYSGLPKGYKPVDIGGKLPEAESNALKQQARKEVNNFEILRMNDVCTLSQELQILEERCQHLRTTHAKLRQGRRSLHNRMISYLKSPRTTKISRDIILRQEEALADLDDSIEEWVTKVDAAEVRRAQVHQKLLEHIAAAMTLQSTGRPPMNMQYTPPISPDKEIDYFNNQRKDVQSIKVFASEGVAALLNELEKEIGTAGHPVTPL